MERLLNKEDYEYNFELLKPKQFEIWAKVDSMGRNIVYWDNEYKISIDSFQKPSLVNLYYNSNGRDIKVGELICIDKYFISKNNHTPYKYLSMKYVKVDTKHKGRGLSYRMVNSLLSVLNEEIKGIITNFDQRDKNSSVVKMFHNLGAFRNEFGYLEIQNPKRNE
jgi:hypothetical protein